MIGAIVIIMLCLVLPSEFLTSFVIPNYDINETTSNVVIYEQDDLKYIITNETSGLLIGEIKLITPLHNIIPVGYHEIAEIEIKNGADNYDELIKSMELYHIVNGELIPFERQIDYKVKIDVEVPKYDTFCEEVYNITNSSYYYINCQELENGTEEVEQIIELTDNFIPANKKMKLSLWTEVEKGDHCEWIINLYGERLIEWAEWEAGDSNTRTTTLTPQYTLPDNPATLRLGIKITVGYENVFLTKVTTMTGDTADWAYLVNASNLEWLNNQSITNNNATFDYMLIGNMSYYIIVGTESGTWTTTRKDSLSFPIDMTEVSFVKGRSTVDDATRAWSIQSLDLAEAIFIGPELILNITGTLNFSNGTPVNLGDVYAVWQGNNTVAKNTTSDVNGNWNLYRMANATYLITGYDPTNASIDGVTEAHVVVGT